MSKQWTQAQCDEANALREYERANRVWMNASVFTQAGIDAKQAMAKAREAYVTAVKVAHPTWIVM